MSQRVFVTGMGIISSAGMNTPEHLDSLLQLRTGFGRIELLPTVHKDTLPAFEIKLTDDELRQMLGVPDGEGYSRTAMLGIIAVREALRSAHISDMKEARTGLISSTTVGGMREFEACYMKLIDPAQDGLFMQYAHVVDTGEHAERIADHFGIRDYVDTVSTACSSASNAIILGAELIKHGKLDRVICGGSDVLSRFTLNGFNSLMILDKGHCKPFDAGRSGVNLGEGAAYIVLESEEILNNHPKKIWAELSGYSNSNDAYHQTASSPDGDGAMLSMQRAMDMAGLKTSDIQYINCHGTATENNDLSEALAIQKLFGEHVPAFASTKPYTGHTLAAAGGVEAIFSLLSIEHEVAFPNLNFKEQMPETTIAPLTSLKKDFPIKNILSNSFGFGGSNTTLLFSKTDFAPKPPEAGHKRQTTPVSISKGLGVKYYIQGIGNISPQRSFDNHEFLPVISEYHSNVLSCVLPEFKNYIHPVQLRRMSRMFKIGLSAAKICAQDAQLTMPDGIITASGYGCIGDTSRFLLEVIENVEKQLTPTLFMQSTYNSISGGIAMAMKCNNYNTTYVHRGFAFETALQDAMMQIADHPSKRILIGGFDETNEGQFAISIRTGYHRKDHVGSLSLFKTEGRGTLQGEGAAFFVLGGEKTANTYAQVSGLDMVYAPKGIDEITDSIARLLEDAGISLADVDIMINGIGGDTIHDQLSNEVMAVLFSDKQQVVFKHLSGDYCTASSFGLWLGAQMLRTQSVPEIVKVNHTHSGGPIRHILLLNHFRGKNYGIVLMSSDSV